MKERVRLRTSAKCRSSPRSSLLPFLQRRLAMTLLTRPSHIPTSLLHLTLNSLQSRALSSSSARESYGFADSSSSSSSRGSSSSYSPPTSRGRGRPRAPPASTSGGRGKGPTAYARPFGARPLAGFGLRDDAGPWPMPDRGERSARGGRGGGAMGRGGGRDQPASQRRHEMGDEPYHLPGDDEFGMGEDGPYTKVSRVRQGRNEAQKRRAHTFFPCSALLPTPSRRLRAASPS